ncbi:MAG: MFS transporter [Propionibacteriaceae bacterium]
MPSPTPPVIGWRRLAVAAYAPTTIVGIGHGAVLPLVVLSARDLGAGVGTAALIGALLGVGQLAGDLPAGALAARFGEKRALVSACVVEVAALIWAFLSTGVVMLGGAILVMGLAGAVFSLARQAYLTEVVEFRYRARALSTLGGVFRFGSFAGPFAGAVIITRYDIGAAYAFAAIMTTLAALLTLTLPNLEPRAPERPDGAVLTRRRSVLAVLADHKRVLLLLGFGVLLLSAARSSRQSILPLWAESHGIDAATTSVIYGISAGVDMLLFFPGGAVMDRFGRVAVAVPSMIIMGLGFTLLPFTSAVVTITLVAALLGLGNGISSGIVMTLGADASPPGERAQFLGGWRLMSDLGNALGPLTITVVTLVAPLAAAAWVLGAMTFFGAGWLGRWVPRFAPPPASPR